MLETLAPVIHVLVASRTMEAWDFGAKLRKPMTAIKARRYFLI
jgi:hypothetical protein